MDTAMDFMDTALFVFWWFSPWFSLSTFTLRFTSRITDTARAVWRPAAHERCVQHRVAPR